MSEQAKTSQGRAVRTVRVRGGKDYVEVSERVRLAHEEGGYVMLEPSIFQIGERWYYRAGILVDAQTFYGTAEIKFGAKPGTADGDAPLECAETSAVGRAFAFAGIGILDGIASADEVVRVQQQHGQTTRQQPAAAQQRTSEPAPEVTHDDKRPVPLPAQSGPAGNYDAMRDTQMRREAAMLGYRSQAEYETFVAEATGGDVPTKAQLQAYAEQLKQRKAKAS